MVVCAVPWARRASRFTRSFEEQICWLAVHTSKSAVAELMRVAWRTVGDICERVMAEAEHADGGRLDGLRRLGIDEISWRKGQRYLTVVVDHDTGRLVWAAAGANTETLAGFFALLGAERCQRIELISADMGAWIAKAARQACPRAELCLDPFHIVALATAALDQIRREIWNDARRAGQAETARELKGARWAPWKNPEALTGRQAAKLAAIQKTNRRLFRAYLLKEQLREIFRLPRPTRSPCSTAGSRGPAAADWRRSSGLPRPLPSTGPGSPRRSYTGFQTPASRPPTRASG